MEKKDYLKVARYIDSIPDTDIVELRKAALEVLSLKEIDDFYIFTASLIVFKVYKTFDDDLESLMDVLFLFELKPENIAKMLIF